MCISPFINAQTIDNDGNRVNIEELTNKFLWEYFFEMNDDWDSKLGPESVVEPILKLYPFMEFLIDHHPENSDIIYNLPDGFVVKDVVDSFNISIPDSFDGQVVSADHFHAPNMIYPGRYYQLTPLIPTHKEDHYLSLIYRHGRSEFPFSEYRVSVLLLQYTDEDFRILDRNDRFGLGYPGESLFQGYLKLAQMRSTRHIEGQDSLLLTDDLIVNDNTLPEMDSAITEKPADLMCSIFEHLYTLTPEMEKDYDFLNHINFLNHGNRRLDYLMNYLLKYLPDKFGNHKVYEWDVQEGQVCDDKRGDFRNDLPWVIDLQFVHHYSHIPPKIEFNMSMSNLYYTKHRGIIAILDFFKPARTIFPQIYLLRFEYDNRNKNFNIVDSSILFGDMQTILYIED